MEHRHRTIEDNCQHFGCELAKRVEQNNDQCPSESEDEEAWKDCDTCMDLNGDLIKRLKASSKKKAPSSPKGEKKVKERINRCKKCGTRRDKRLEKKFEHITEFWNGNNFGTLFNIFNVVRSDYLLRQEAEKYADISELKATKEEIIRLIITVTTLSAD